MNSSKRTRLLVFLVGSTLVIAALAGGPLTTLAHEGGDHEGGDVVTPTPSNNGPGDDPYDCGDFETVEQVHAVFASEAPGDKSGLDADDDNIPCEGPFPDQMGPVTPAAPSTQTTTETPTGTAPATETASPTDTATDTPTATATATAPATATDTATATAEPTETATPEPTATETEDTTDETADATPEDTTDEQGRETDCPEDA